MVTLGLACTSAGAPPAGNGGAAGAPPVANPYKTSACGTCVATQCAGVMTGCGEDPECASYIACLDACPTSASGDADASCVAKCPSPTGTAGQQALTAFEACRAGTAALACAACGDPPPDGGRIPLLTESCPASQATDPCHQCDDEKCCVADDACTANAQCTAIINCLPNAATYGDAVTCIEQHPAGALAFTQRFACRQILCTNPTNCPGTKQTTCDACIVASCPDSFAELIGTPHGFALYYACAVGQCGSATSPAQFESCLLGCKQMYPDAAAAFDDLYVCSSERCACL